MTGPINNHGGLGVNGSKAGAMGSGQEKTQADSADSEANGQSGKAQTDEVSLSAAGKQLQEATGTRAATKLETPEQAAAMAKEIAMAIEQDGTQALAAQGSGNVSGLRGLLMSA